MCGIVGLVDFNGNNIDKLVIETMTTAIGHRGPSGSGVYIKQSVGLGNSRLAIIDPEGASQPLSNEDLSIWVTYNGEVYNFPQLKNELLGKNHVFRSNSDTEMVVHAYEEWGEKCVEKFRGMFAFAIVDFGKKKVFIARDQLGIKPLYYLITNQYFAFASELQALKMIPEVKLSINFSAIDQYLWLQYIPAPDTVYTEVKKLLPAHRMTISFDGKISGPEEYWKVEYKPDYSRSESEWIEATDETIYQSVKAHLISDVPFGAFLSGGIDSSTVVGYMSKILNQPVMTFTIGFEENDYSEVDYANKVAKRWNTNHHIEIIKPNAIEILPDLVKHYGEPFGDSSAIPTYYVSKLAQSYVPMVLSGDGGDEAFGGYNTYQYWLRYMTGVGLPTWKKIIRPVANLILPNRYPSKPNLFRWLKYVQYLGPMERKKLWKPEFRYAMDYSLQTHEHEFNRARHFSASNLVQYMDLKTYLPYDILTKVDIASMMHGLEVRTPIVDIKVIEFAATIPPKYKITQNGQKEWIGKMILKKVLEKDYPLDFIYRPKMGFSIPAVHWFNKDGPYYKELIYRLLGKKSKLNMFFEKEEISKLIYSNNTGPIWCLLFLEEWLNQNSTLL